ncbi:MAG: oligosaccharide flippase family protein [Elusimicrobia bacterium]|nr:oligosaccharide flippase family protein [Elusimicrobiota bacterium]
MKDQPSRSVRFASNAVWNLVGQFGLAVLSLALIPFLIRRLGSDGYALYCMLGILGGYLAMLSLGATSATQKFVAELGAAGKTAPLRAVLGVSFLLHAAGAGLGALAVLRWREPLALHFFQIPPYLQGPALRLFGYAALGAVFMSLNKMGLAVLQGLQRYRLVNLLLAFESGGMLGGSALLLLAGKGVVAIAALFVAIQALLGAASLGLAFNRLAVTPAWEPQNKESAAQTRRFLKYGLTTFVGSLAYSIPFQWDKAVIGYLLPISQLTYYLIPAAIMQKFWVLPGTISYTAFPLFSELHGRDDQASLRRVYCRCSQLVLWAVMPGFALLMVVSPQFLTLWLGPKFSLYGTWPLRFLLLGYMINFMAAIPGAAITGTGHLLRYSTAASMAFALACCFFWWLLVPRWGISGAALGFCLANVAAFVPYIGFTNSRLFGMSFEDYLEHVLLRPLFAGTLLFLFLWVARFQLFSWQALILYSGATVLVYLGLAYMLLDADGHVILRGIIKAFLKRLS